MQTVQFCSSFYIMLSVQLVLVGGWPTQHGLLCSGATGRLRVVAAFSLPIPADKNASPVAVLPWGVTGPFCSASLLPCPCHMCQCSLSVSKFIEENKSFLSRVLLVSLFAREALLAAAWSAGLPEAFPAGWQRHEHLCLPAQPRHLPCGVENRLSRIMTLGCTPCSIRTLTASITVLPVPIRGKSEIFVFLLKNSFLSQPGLYLHQSWCGAERQYCPVPLVDCHLCKH